MTALGGYFGPIERAVKLLGGSSNLDNQSGLPFLAIYREDTPTLTFDGPMAISGPHNFTHWTLNGALYPGFESILFEKIILTPKITAFGFIFTDQNFTWELRSTFQNSERKLTGINLNGPGGVVVSNPGLPHLFEPTNILIINGLMPANGVPTITNSVSFVFQGIDSSTTWICTGLRMTPFIFSPDWTNGLTEGIEYTTKS